MKAKRLLSAFVAVAMMVTMLVSFSTVASADTVKPTIKVEFVKMTDAEFADVQTTTTCTAAEGSVGYWLVGTLKDYGTVDCPDDTSCGRKFMNINVLLDFENDVTTYFEQSSKMNVKMWKADQGVTGKALLAIANGNSKRVTIDFAATGYDSAYPNTVGTSNSDELTWIKVPVYVKAETPITATVAYANVTATTFEWGEIKADASYATTNSTINADETVIIGEAGPVVVPPTVGGSEEAATGFDNAFAVDTTITVGSATEIGVLFAPALWLGAEKLTVDLEGAKKAVYDGEALGKGTLTLRAAIKDIPYELKGKAFKMVTRAYAANGADVTYADAVETDYTAFAE